MIMELQDVLHAIKKTGTRYRKIYESSDAYYAVPADEKPIPYTRVNKQSSNITYIMPIYIPKPEYKTLIKVWEGDDDA